MIGQNLSLFLILSVSIIFVVIGIVYSKKYRGLNNYLTANRDIRLLSLTTSLVASALGTWILFGPASAATWGGIGSVIGYSLGTAFPMIALIYLGIKLRNIFPKGKTLTEFIKKRFGKKLFTHTQMQDKKTDLIIQVTPSIVKDNYSGIDKKYYHIDAEDKFFNEDEK